MTARERQRRRQQRRKDPARAILIAGGALFGALAIAVLAGVAVRLLDRREGAAAEATSRSLILGEASTVYYSRRHRRSG